jgi:hypothetical protein
VYLTSAREHPAAVVVRQQQHAVTRVAHVVRDFSERQSRLFFGVTAFLLRYESGDLQPIIDEDAAEAAEALGRTFETASRGVIYEHRPASLPAGRLATAIAAMLAEIGKNAPTSFDRDAGVVLKRIADAIREERSANPTNRRAWLDLIGWVIRPPAAATKTDGRSEPEPSRLIVP